MQVVVALSYCHCYLYAGTTATVCHQPEVARSVRVKLASPVCARPVAPTLACTAATPPPQEQEIMVQPFASPMQLPLVSPLAGWLAEEPWAKLRQTEDAEGELIHVAEHPGMDLDLGAHFRAQADATTPEFGFLVSLLLDVETPTTPSTHFGRHRYNSPSCRTPGCARVCLESMY